MKFDIFVTPGGLSPLCYVNPYMRESKAFQWRNIVIFSDITFHFMRCGNISSVEAVKLKRVSIYNNLSFFTRIFYTVECSLPIFSLYVMPIKRRYEMSIYIHMYSSLVNGNRNVNEYDARFINFANNQM